VRLSGPQVIQCLRKCFAAQDETALDQIDASICLTGKLRLASLAGDLPCDLYLWPTNRSYTRQPSAEIHTVGSPPLLDAVMSTLCESGARLAQPGEFTMRAFLAGRLDLTQAEAVLGVIDAAGQRELDTALSQLAGGLANPLNELRNQLLDLLAHLEAGLDFVEEDIEFISTAELESQLTRAIDVVTAILDQIRNRLERLPERRVVLTGWPNVGKSSLLNALAGQQVSIVSDESGTTRDYVTGTVNLSGLSVNLIDTAGVDSSGQAHSPESLAQVYRSQQSEQAHLRLLCLDGTRPLNQWEREQLASQQATTLVALTKCDQPKLTDFQGSAVETSSSTQEGLSSLCNQIRERLVQSTADDAAVLGSTGTRCQESLRMTVECLQRAHQANSQQLGEELVASEVRLALNELGKVVGTVYTDDILDRIFGSFCIGK
jgi:tRNA modification GTPase